jgi:hypothetical protein
MFTTSTSAVGLRTVRKISFQNNTKTNLMLEMSFLVRRDFLYPMEFTIFLSRLSLFSYFLFCNLLFQNKWICNIIWAVFPAAQTAHSTAPFALGPSCSLEGTTGYLKSNVSFMTITGP